MRNGHRLIFLFLFFPFIIMGQNELPKEIIIFDFYLCPWSGRYEYQYKLKHTENQYNIYRVSKVENEVSGKKRKSNSTKKIGKINQDVIESLIYLISTDTIHEIQLQSFTDIFTKENITKKVNLQKKYKVEQTSQKNYLIDRMMDTAFLESILKKYFSFYDYSLAIDGATSKIEISFSYKNTNYKVVSNSSIDFAFPLIINGKEYYSRKISNVLSKIIPESKTQRKRQLNEGNKLMESVISSAIDVNYKELDSIGVWDCCKDFIQELQPYFQVASPIIERSYSLNWNGEKRFNAQLQKINNPYNIYVDYSIEMKNDSLL